MVPFTRFVEENFPRLRGTAEYRRTSDWDPFYNCIAFAAGDDQRWWWPPLPNRVGDYWPSGAPAEETVAAFVAAFATRGYVTCADGAFELGIEKVAVYARKGGPTHAARQNPVTGEWMSKLGRGYDISHSSADLLGGSDYGEVEVYLQRESIELRTLRLIAQMWSGADPNWGDQ